MIRIVTCLAVLVAVLAAAGLYRVKLRTADLATAVATLDRNIAKEEEAISVLRAEWSLLNHPERLQILAERHLDLEPMAAEQLVIVETLPKAARTERPAPMARPWAALPEPEPFPTSTAALKADRLLMSEDMADFSVVTGSVAPADAPQAADAPQTIDDLLRLSDVGLDAPH